MDETVLESYLDKVAQLVVDEDKIVTYKSLSKSLCIHINTAKQLLYTYLAKEKSKNSFPISATYLLAGRVVDGSFNITIVNEPNLKDAYSKFIQITSEHVYSIQKNKTLKDLKLLSEYNKKSCNIQSSDPVIKCLKSVLKVKKEVKRSSEFNDEKNNIIIKQALLQEKQAVNAAEVSGLNENATVKESSLESHKKQSVKGNFGKSQGGVKKLGKQNIANMFAKSAQKNMEKSAASGKSDTNMHKSEPGGSEVSAHNKGNEVVTLKTKDIVPEITDGGNFKKNNESTDTVKKKKKGKKRLRIQLLSDSEENSSNDDEEETLNAEEADILLSTNNLKEIKEENEKPISQNKRKKRKVIDRTVMNENGYLETQKEVVLETDSEPEEQALESKTDQKSKDEQAIERNKQMTILGGKPAKKQSSLLSFFKKN